MHRSWRRAAIAALAGAGAFAAQLTATVPAQAAGPSITIAASSKFKVVTSDVFVVYHDGAASSARIHGTISGAAAGEVAILFAQQFPFKKAPVKAATVTFKAAKAAYSFTVTPTLYTKYAVRVFASKTATNPLVTSPVRNVYVTGNGYYSPPRLCGRPVCHETFLVYSIVPASTQGVEMAKHAYPYFGLNLSPTGSAPPPAWYYLNAGNARVSKPRRLSAIEYVNTLTYSFTVGSDGYNWNGLVCFKDDVYKDGLGLPGSHGCGARRIPASFYYLG
jgi:hypothetical protein